VPIRLLFVDDEPAIRTSLPAILRMHGMEVTAVSTVQEALETMQHEKFDVLLSDLNIGQPGDGFTVVSAMRRTQPEAATFILTGYPDFESALVAIRNQVDEYLVKPADVEALVRAITEKVSHGPVKHTPIQLKRVSQILREHVDHIVESWYARVEGQSDLRRVQLNRQQRINDLPVIVEELIRRVESADEDTSEEAVQAALDHGRVRYEQGYTIPMMVKEARILQNVISTTVQANLLAVDLSRLIPDMIEIGESLATQLEEAIKSYQQVALRQTA
jgi:YesN/AraC family two-component response regulator